MKVYLTTNTPHYAKVIPNAEIVDAKEDANLIIFTGGEDVYPAIYGERTHDTTNANIVRDVFEISVYLYAKAKKIPMLGICRGAQFLTVMAGGKLIQNVNNHALAKTHDLIFTDNSPTIQITSTHHQMMYPFNLKREDFELIAHGSERSTIYEMSPVLRLKRLALEPEIVYYPKENSLCIQGHPERMTTVPETINKIRQIIKNKLFNGKKNVFRKKSTTEVGISK